MAKKTSKATKKTKATKKAKQSKKAVAKKKTVTKKSAVAKKKAASKGKKTSKAKRPAKIGAANMAVTDAASFPILSVQLSHEPTRVPWAKRNYIGVRLFAGAPDPRWEIPEDVAAKLNEELGSLPEAGSAMDFPDEGDFYGGIIVHLIQPDRRRRAYLIFEQTILDCEKDVVRRDAGRQIEARLYKTMPDIVLKALDNLNFELATTPLMEQHRVTGVAATESRPRCEGAPRFLPPPPFSKWDKFPGVQDNNCYNYANDEFSDIDDAQPGRRQFRPMTENEMHERLLSDHLIPVGPDRKRLPNACHTEEGSNLIAVALRRRSGQKMENGVMVPVFKDFHCFRLDATGTWSHKDGSHRSRNTDSHGTLLRDLADARFRVIHELVGYYWSVPSRRRIGMPRN